jgi:uncharacterized protein (TIGR03000 family)
MFAKALSLGGMLLLAAAALLLVPAPEAAARQRGHAGFRGGAGFRGAGFRGPAFRGGFRPIVPAARFAPFRPVVPAARFARVRSRSFRSFPRSWFGAYGLLSYPYYYYPSYSVYPSAYDDDLYFYDPDLWEDLYGIPEDYGPFMPVPPDVPSVPEDTPEPANAPAAAPARAHIQLRVPASAEVWFEGQKMAATGSLRDFRSPPLEPGQRYVYEIKARWRQGGRSVTQTQRVGVEAGANVTVTFPVPRRSKAPGRAATP